ncbi:MAG: TRAP transporter small permease subunit [Pseudorhodobacter sp.]|nr:TRAP transporter small permease subunit [Pseudorhodobacter sp.]
MLDGISWFIQNIGLAFVNLWRAISQPSLWLDWSNSEALARFIYYGASAELFFVILTIFLILTAVGIWKSQIMWGVVRGLEGFANALGRTVAWVGLIMVLQQIMIIFLQRIFRVSTIEFGPFAPFGYTFWDKFTLISHDLSWWSEELKLYNAMIVTLCVTYTFVQGGHVRVDLLYSNVGYRTRKMIDMVGSLLFMMSGAILTWLFAWFFMWRSLITPKVSASDKIEMLLRKAKLMKWNVETIGFSPNGFNAYFLFKILLVSFCALVFLQAVAFFYRSLLEWREGPESEGKYHDRDNLGDVTTHELTEGTN